jgi:hypothetical protein
MVLRARVNSLDARSEESVWRKRKKVWSQSERSSAGSRAGSETQIAYK